MFATMRRKRRSAIMKNELGQGVDHFKRAATIAAHETSATVGPKLNAAKDRVQPAASKAKDAASSSWDSAVATLTPLVAAAGDNIRQAGKVSKRQAKASKTSAKKNAKKLERRTNKALGRKQRRRRASKLLGYALIGTAVGAGAAYFVRKRKAAQWDEYDPTAPIASTKPDSVVGADDAAFEPADPTTAYDAANPAAGGDLSDQTSTPRPSAKVTRMASKNKD
jgi:hypothetical protein